MTTTNLTNFFDAQGLVQSQSQSFSGLQADDLVRAEGLLGAGSLVATSVRRVP